MNNLVELEILKIVSERKANWNWLTIDRALSSRGFAGQCNVAQIAQKLCEQGLLQMRVNGNPSMPIYSMTESGRQSLAGVRVRFV